MDTIKAINSGCYCADDNLKDSVDHDSGIEGILRTRASPERSKTAKGTEGLLINPSVPFSPFG